jgi:hypothetical protein
MRKHYLLAFGFTLFTIPPSGAANISGHVTDETGAPIAQVVVVWAGFSTPQGGGAAASARNQTPTVIHRGSGFSDASGRFETADLPAADYLVCVTSLAEQSHLSTCEWRANEARLTMLDAPQTLNLVVRRGSVLKFHIADPKSRLTRSNVSVIVSAPNKGFAHARVLSLTPTQAELFVAVPFNSKIAAVINAPARLHDGNGASVPLGVPALPTTISREAVGEISLTLE